MNRTRARVNIPLFFILILLALSAFIVYGNPDELTVSTDKSSYHVGDSVDVYGSLTLGGTPITNGLVAVQVQHSDGGILVIRTVPTGTLPPPWKVKILRFLSCDQDGKPVTNFKVGSFAYFSVTVQNMDILSRSVIITINVLDAGGMPISAMYVEYPLESPIPAGQILTFGTSLKILEEVSLGSAGAYANVYTKWPKDGGFPYCPEASVAFTISGKTSSSADQASTSSTGPKTRTASAGSYNLMFTLPAGARPGTYKVYVRARYNAEASSSIDVVWLYADLNRDGKVNILDVSTAAAAFGSRPGDPHWNPFADLNRDSLINIIDIATVARDFGKSQT
jgi:hypothetical protein